MNRVAVPARLGAVVAVAAAFAFAIVPLIPPAAPSGAPAEAFSAVEAMVHIREIAGDPHPMGTRANAGVGAYLAGELARLGLEVTTQPVEVPDYFGVTGGTVEIVNVAGRIGGTASTGSVVLMAHYDSDDSTPGANDDAAAVAALLETARVLTSEAPLRNDVVILLTDAEEPAPRYGSDAYFDRHPWAVDSAVVVNFEALGHAGPAVLVEATSPDRWLIDAYRAAAPHPAAFSFLPDVIGRLGEIGTDFDVVRRRGIAGLHFAYSRGSSVYHTMRDTPDSVGVRSLQQHGEHAVGLATVLGAMDLNAASSGGDLVAFTIGRRLLSYPTGWAAATAVLLPLGLVAALVVRRRTGASSPRSMLASGLRTLGGCLAGAVVGTLAWVTLTSLRPTPGVVEGYAYLAILLAVTALLADAAGRLGGRRADRWDQLAGVVTMWTVTAVVVGIAAPATGYLFVWPALAATAAAIIALRYRPTRLIHHAGFTALVAFPAFVLVVPAIEIFFQLAQPRPGNPDSELTAMMAVPLLLGGLTIELIRRTIAVDPGAPAAD